MRINLINVGWLRDPMQHERYSRWVKASPATGPFEHFMMVVVQGLGRLDCQLIQEDSRYCSLPEAQQQTIAESIKTSDRFTLSYLWVLGAYELVRTMDQRVRDKTSLISASLPQRLSELKRAFKRVRIPLAKMEPAKAHKDTDSPIAFPALHSEQGISWQLTRTDFVSRRELSDALLGFLEDLRSHDPHFIENATKAT